MQNKRTVKRVVKRTVIGKKAKAGDSNTPFASIKSEEDEIEVPTKKESVEHVEEVKDAEPVKHEELSPNDENDDTGVSQEDDKDAVEGSSDVVRIVEFCVEMKTPVIHGKRRWTAPSVERITLVAHPQHEGLSRGFAFIEFSGHPDV
ncbi:hypothetical protein Tco_0458175 [Tanacetum coccineum]